MRTIEDYQRALQKAQAANDAEAVAYFQGKIAELSQKQNIDSYMKPEQGAAQSRIQKIQADFANQTGVTVPESVIAGLVGAGKGATDIVRGLKSLVGMDNEVPEGEVENWQALQDEYPISSTVGEIGAQAAPFVAAGPLAAAGRAGGARFLTGVGGTAQQGLRAAAVRAGQSMAQPLSRKAMIGGQAGLGAAEGGLIMAGQAEPMQRINKLQQALQKAEANNDAEAVDYFREQIANEKSGRAIQTATGAGVGGTLAGAMEAVLPGVGRAISKIGRKLIFKEGQPSKEVLEALAREGITPEEAKPVLQRIYAEYGDAANPDDVAAMALFEKYDIPASQGDISRVFEQQAAEARLVESAADDLGQPMRELRRGQSDRMRDILERQIKELGVPERAGETLKGTLGQRKTRLKAEQRALYDQLAQEASNVDAIPLDIGPGIDFETIDDIGAINESGIKGLKRKLNQYGIGDPQDIEALAESGVEITPLSLKNAERFRKMLNNIRQADPQMQAATSSVIRSLDDQYDLALGALEEAGRQSDLGDVARSARVITREIKTEFDPQSTVGRLVATKRNGIEPVVEASNALRDIFTTGQVNKREKLQRVISSLQKEGDAGKAAIGDLQSAAIQRIIDDSFNAASRTIDGERVLSGASFQRALDKFGDGELEILFKNNPQALKTLRDMRNIAERITPPGGAIPKGSGSVILDSLNRLGIMSLSSKVPGIGVALEGMQSLVGKKAKRKAAQEAGKAVPRWTQREIARARQIQETMPQLAAALGISAITEEDKEQPEEDNNGSL